MRLLSAILKGQESKSKKDPNSNFIQIDKDNSIFSTGLNANLFYEFARLHDSQMLGAQMKTIIYSFLYQSMNNSKLTAKSSNINTDPTGNLATHGNFVATITDIIKNATVMMLQLQTASQFANDPASVALARAICKVVYYYTYHSCDKDDEQVRGICEYTCSILNEMNRDTVLFKCLEIPNDKLKLIIVKILNAVNPKQYEEGQQKRFWAILKEHKNVGAGKNEIVIGTILLILTKVKQYLESSAPRESGKTESTNFIMINYANFISIALEMMRKNMGRDLQSDLPEQKEKDILNLCIVVFLKAMTSGVIPPGIESTNNLDAISLILRDESMLNPKESQPAEVEKTIGCLNTKCTSVSSYRPNGVPSESKQQELCIHENIMPYCRHYGGRCLQVQAVHSDSGCLDRRNHT